MRCIPPIALKLVSSDGSFSRAWDSLADFDPATKIPVGAYTMSAFYGDIDIEGFEKPFYLGETPVAVRDRENSSVEINCTLANVKVTVEYSDAFKKYFADYSTTIHSTGGEYIEFSKTGTPDSKPDRRKEGAGATITSSDMSILIGCVSVVSSKLMLS